jgi:hypothetical protein
MVSTVKMRSVTMGNNNYQFQMISVLIPLYAVYRFQGDTSDRVSRVIAIRAIHEVDPEEKFYNGAFHWEDVTTEYLMAESKDETCDATDCWVNEKYVKGFKKCNG